MDDKSPLALYYQLKQILEDKIVSGAWQVGEQIPTENELCELYGVSRITVREALAELEREGYITRKRGRGTFVAVPKIEQNLMGIYSFTEEFRKRGLTPHSEVLEFVRLLPEKNIQEALGIGGAQAVHYLKRLRFADDVLMAIECTYLPCSCFPNLSRERVVEEPLYDVLRSDYDLVLTSAQETFGAVLIQPPDSSMFGVSSGAPGLELERYSYSGTTCVEYTIGVIRGDKFKFTVRLE
ncbi:MAG: GntR family transcriptional regulator [Firmicutes bacterium]|nr:GntR family transcriptional regulator [Bacillota bacterium]